MKKILSLLSLAALTLGLLGSCSKINERIDSLEKRIDGIESTSIASVQQQIDGIKASITKLEAADVTVNGKIDELKATAETHQTLIDALKEADKALGQKDDALEARIATLEGQVTTINGQIDALVNADIAINTRIDELKTYVDTEIGKTKDWAEETFATLEQYQQTADDLAALSVTVTGISTTLAGMQTSISGLDTRIDSLDTALQGRITSAKTELEGKITGLKTELEDKIATAITASETSIKSWINELLEGYYTIAQVDAKIGSLNTAIEAAKGTAKTRIDSVATELTELKKVVDTEKATIRTEYKEAIKVAIDSLDGEIRGALLDSIAAVNGRIEALDTRVTTLEGKVLALEGNVNKLLAMIQSVSITPAYSDGSVEAVDGILTLKCIVSPAEALTGMQSLKDSLLIYADSVKVKTKATTPAYMAIKVSEASALDAAQGAITLTADISEYLPKGEDKALTVAVNIKNGISNFTTEFVPVTLAAPAPLPAGALKGVFSVSATKKVRFSKGNLQYVVAGKTWGFYENQYDFCNTKIYQGHHSDTVSLFTWGYDATKSIIPDGKDSDNVSITSGNLSPEQDWGCAVGDGKTWRTLTAEEWQYLFSDKSRYGFATVGGVNGIIILPDTFADPMRNGGSGAFKPNKTGYGTNVYTAGGNWEAMESAGAVFLSAAGFRNGSNIDNYGIGFVGYYWSSTARNGAVNAFDVTINEYQVTANYFTNGRSYGKSVRLVTDVK